MKTEALSGHPTVQSGSHPVRIFISTGEVSGDLQGALLVTALLHQAAQFGWDLEITALGGDRMAQAGATLLGQTSSIGSVGVWEALPHILPTLQLQRRAKQYLQDHPPDLVVLIDYMGPNLTLGEYLHKSLPQVPVVYYIAPQAWVGRPMADSTEQIIRVTDKILAIFPEEARYYQQHGANVTWVGHPLIDRLQSAPSRDTARSTLGIAADETAIALLPASRWQELKYLLPVMFATAQQLQAQLPQVRFWIPLSLETYRSYLENAIQEYGLRATLVTETHPQPLTNPSLQVIAAADLAITKSGTANLEIALLNVPQVVLYRVSPITAWLARKVLKFSIPFMSPPNLVEMKPIVPEFLQEEATPEKLTAASLALLLDPTRRQQTLADYAQMRQALGEVGACDRAAQAILSLVQSH